MGKYKLLKDLPSIPKGVIAKDDGNGVYFFSVDNIYGKDYTEYEVTHNPDWFEKLKSETENTPINQ